MIVKPKIFQDSGTYLVRFLYLDIENGVLVHKNIDRYVNAGETVVAPSIDATLAATANSCALEFVEWNHTDLTNVNWNKVIGATYRNATESGIRKTHAFVVVTSASGLVLPVYFNKSDTSTLTISWGDGSADYTTTSSGNLNTTHTYSTAGKYEIKMWISSGTGTYGFGNGSSTTVFLAGNTTSYYDCLRSLFIGDNVVTLPNYSLYTNRSLSIISIPKNVTSIANSVFRLQFNLRNITLPNSVTSIGDSGFRDFYGLRNISLPISLTTIAASAFAGCINLERLHVPSSVTSIDINIVSGAYNLKSINFPSGLTTLSTGSCTNCYGLQTVFYNTTLSTLTGFVSCYNISSFVIPNTITTISNSCFQGTGLKSISIPASVTSIPLSCFQGCLGLNAITLNLFTAPSTITTLANTNAFASTNTALRIYVPVGSLAVYQGASNWSTYANQMYEDTAENRALFGD